MSRRARVVSGVVAGIGVFFVDLWPVVLIWRAGTSGSVGDLSEVQVLGASLVFAIGLAIVAGYVMSGALRHAERSPSVGRLDPWGAYALGIGIYNLALTAVPAIVLGLLAVDENQSLRSRMWAVYLIWFGGRFIAALIAFLAARAVLGKGFRHEVEPAPSIGP